MQSICSLSITEIDFGNDAFLLKIPNNQKIDNFNSELVQLSLCAIWRINTILLMLRCSETRYSIWRARKIVVKATQIPSTAITFPMWLYFERDCMFLCIHPHNILMSVSMCGVCVCVCNELINWICHHFHRCIERYLPDRVIVYCTFHWTKTKMIQRNIYFAVLLLCVCVCVCVWVSECKCVPTWHRLSKRCATFLRKVAAIKCSHLSWGRTPFPTSRSVTMQRFISPMLRAFSIYKFAHHVICPDEFFHRMKNKRWAEHMDARVRAHTHISSRIT